MDSLGLSFTARFLHEGKEEGKDQTISKWSTPPPPGSSSSNRSSSSGSFQIGSISALDSVLSVAEEWKISEYPLY